MFRSLSLLLCAACASDVAPAPTHLQRDGAACELLSTLHGADEVLSGAAPLRDPADLEPVAPRFAGLDRVREVWHEAASCTSVTRDPQDLGYLARPFWGHTWLVEDAIDRARAGDTEGAEVILTDVWRVAEALRYGTIMADVMGLAMQRHVLEVMTAELPPERVRERAAAFRADGLPEPALTHVLDIDLEVLDQASWHERTTLKLICLPYATRLRTALVELEALPVSERPAAWAASFSEEEEQSCSWLLGLSSSVEDRAWVQAELERLAGR